MQTVSTYNFDGKRVLVRVDFNVPLDQNLHVSDSTRIDAAIPTIQKILNDGGAVILLSHLGRPKQKYPSVKLGAEKKYSLKNILPILEKKLGQEVLFAEDCASEQAYRMTRKLTEGEVLLLENTRFYEEEIQGDKAFAEILSTLGEVYVNDAFGTAHRAHATTSIIAHFFEPNKKMAGLLMSAEIAHANQILQHTKHPFSAIIGGAKVSDKIDIIDNLLHRANHILIGGGMAYTFLKAKGYCVGNSLVEEDKLDVALALLDKAKAKNVLIHLPVDSIIANHFSENAQTAISASTSIKDNWMGLDIGPQAIDDFSQVILRSKTILWNGPMGVFEMAPFQQGTKKIALAIAKATKENNAYSLIGGGDSVSAINRFKLKDQVSYVSTGGGAMLEYFEGKELPGIKALEL